MKPRFWNNPSQRPGPPKMTLAQTHLQERERQFPPLSRVDRTRQLFSLLEADVPPPLREAYANGKLAMAEIPDATPNAFTTPLDDDNYAIEFNKGLMEFIYAVARTLCGAVNDHGSDGTVVKQAASQEEIVRLIRSVFDQWQSGSVLRGQMAQAPPLLLQPVQIRIAEDLITKAEMFILAHELGHVAMMMNIMDHPTESEELDADVFASKLMLRAGQRLGFRMTYAGSMFAIRVFSGLEKVGHKFTGDYPPPDERLQNLRTWTLHFMQNPEVFSQINTIASAFDELMEAVENGLLGRPSATVQTPERVASRLSVIIDEGARGGLTKEECLSEALSALKDVSAEILGEAAKALRIVYFPQLAPTVQETAAVEWQKKRIGTLQWLVPGLPEPARSIFSQAMPALAHGSEAANTTGS